jgi:hypothetical protein
MGSNDLVDGVPMLLAVQENNHSRVSDIVRTHVIDAHSVGRSNELMLLTKKVTLMEKGRRHQMRRANDSVRDTRVALGLLENVIASSVEIDKGNVLTVAFYGFTLAEKGILNEVLDFLVLALAEECGKYVRPAFHVRKRAKDGVDSLESHFVVVFVHPVKVDDLGTFRFEQVGDFLTETLVSSNLLQSVGRLSRCRHERIYGRLPAGSRQHGSR